LNNGFVNFQGFGNANGIGFKFQLNRNSISGPYLALGKNLNSIELGNGNSPYLQLGNFPDQIQDFWGNLSTYHTYTSYFDFWNYYYGYNSYVSRHTQEFTSGNGNPIIFSGIQDIYVVTDGTGNTTDNRNNLSGIFYDISNPLGGYFPASGGVGHYMYLRTNYDYSVTGDGYHLEIQDNGTNNIYGNYQIAIGPDTSNNNLPSVWIQNQLNLTGNLVVTGGTISTDQGVLITTNNGFFKNSLNSGMSFDSSYSYLDFGGSNIIKFNSSEIDYFNNNIKFTPTEQYYYPRYL
jgi:hypothetical protein